MVVLRRTVWPLTRLLLALAMQPAMAAQRLTPPVEELLDNPEHTRLAVQQYLGQTGVQAGNSPANPR